VEIIERERKSFEKKSLGLKQATLKGYLLSLVENTNAQRIFSSGDVDWDITKNGIFNPSAVFTKKNRGKIIFRCEPEASTWGGHFLEDKAVPMLGDFECRGNQFQMLGNPYPLAGGQIMSMRAEDWRLFKGLDGKVYTNFTNYFFYNKGFPQTETRSTTCIARINGDRLEFLQELSAKDFGKENREEKNWVIFPHRGKYVCIYSVDPYVAFSLDKDFVIRDIISMSETPLPRICQNFMANGTNPILQTNKEYGRHYLMTCHNFTHSISDNKRNRTYWHYVLVLDYYSLKPVAFTPHPILGGDGWEGRHNCIMYVSGMLAHEKNFWFFYGEGDEHSEVCSYPKSTIYQNLVKLC
jgi:predicted GH43/DUF377 family glycosyl hydrolase